MPAFLRSKPVIVIGSIILGLAILGGILFSVLPHDSKTAVAATATPKPSYSALYSDEAPAAAKAVQRLNSEPKSVLSSNALQKLGGNAKKAIPPGTVIKPLPATWHAVGDGSASMLTAVKFSGDKKAKPYLVYMVKENKAWKILGTVEIKVDKK